MIKQITESPLYKIVNPKTCAYFGASNNYVSMGTNQMQSMLDIGFEGMIYPVHPKEDTVLGYKAYRSVLDLPETPDLAVIVLPTHLVPDVVDQCGQKGIRHAVVVSGGFREVGGDGVALEQKLKHTADKHGIRFIGPNCLGVVNTHHKLNTMFHSYKGGPGYVGMASQSGSFVTQMFDYLGPLGLGFSTCFSVGNSTNVDLVDCLEYLGADPTTKVITMYIEALNRGREFVEVCRRIAPNKPIVAYYAGGSETGRKASLSHTGSLAGPDPLYDGIFRQAGVVRAMSIEELFDYAAALALSPLPKGKRMVVQTHSGGPGAVCADMCGRMGLELPPLADNTVTALKEYLPATGNANNPVDVTFSRDPMVYLTEMPSILLDDANTDGLLMYFLFAKNRMVGNLVNLGMSQEEATAAVEQQFVDQSEKIAGLINDSGKPLIGFSFRIADEELIQMIRSKGVPILGSPVRAAKAMAALLARRKMIEKIQAGENWSA